MKHFIFSLYFILFLNKNQYLKINSVFFYNPFLLLFHNSHLNMDNHKDFFFGKFLIFNKKNNKINLKKQFFFYKL